jgi:hypothetical protein
MIPIVMHEAARARRNPGQNAGTSPVKGVCRDTSAIVSVSEIIGITRGICSNDSLTATRRGYAGESSGSIPSKGVGRGRSPDGRGWASTADTNKKSELRIHSLGFQDHFQMWLIIDVPVAPYLFGLHPHIN